MPSGQISIPNITLIMIVYDVIPKWARMVQCLLVVVVVQDGGVNRKDGVYWMKRCIRVGQKKDEY